MVGLMVTVEHFWREVEPVRPDNGAGLVIDPNPREVCRVCQGPKQRAAVLTPDVLDVTDHAVAEQQAHHVRTDHRHTHHSGSHTRGHGNGSIGPGGSPKAALCHAAASSAR